MNIDKAAIELLKAATSADKVAKRFREIGDALRGEKTMKTIKDLVIQHKGIWPEEVKNCESFLLVLRHPSGEREEINVVKSEFESEAKRMGYINGYRYGVEYPTNGERPELADDVVIGRRADGVTYEWAGDVPVKYTDWSMITHFKITDQRYKPDDTSYLNASTQTQSLTHSEEGLTHKAVDKASEISESNANELAKSGGGGLFSGLVSIINVGKIETGDNGGKGPLGHNPNKDSWHERGELPPVGGECLALHGDDKEWYKVEVLKHRTNNGGMKVAAVMRLDNFNVFWCSEFKPLPAKSEREKVIEAAMSVFYNGDYCERMASALYDAGMLVLTPKKSDTED